MRQLIYKDQKKNSKIPTENEEIIIFVKHAEQKVRMKLICIHFAV